MSKEKPSQKPPPPQRVHRYVSNDFTIRASAVDATAVVQEMQKLQTMAPLPTVAVGRLMVGALLMASNLKQGQQLGLYIRSGGVLGSVFAEAHFDGQVRGYTPHALYEPAEYAPELTLKEHIGDWLMSVTRHQPYQKQPFTGAVQLVNGEIGDDIAYYLHQSQQIRSLVSLGVYLDSFGQVRAAGGLLIEVMPGVEDAVIEKIEANAKKAKVNVSKMLLEGVHPTHLVIPYMEGIPFTELDHDYPITYSCPCDKDRVLRAVETLGVEELQDMINKSEEAEVTCQMCGKPYKIPVNELEEIRTRLYKQSLN
jgi:molecular chaperone Hsp33